MSSATTDGLKAVVVSETGTYLVRHRDNSMGWTRKLDSATQFEPEEALRIALGKTTHNGWSYSVMILPRVAQPVRQKTRHGKT